MNNASRPQASSQQLAQEKLQARQLDEEIGKGEKRFKALARNKLGSKSLIADKAVGAAVSAPKSLYNVKKKAKPKSFGVKDMGAYNSTSGGGGNG